MEGKAVEEMPGESLVGELDPERAVFGAIYPGDATRLGHPEEDVAYRWVRRGEYKLIVPVGPEAWGGYLKEPSLFNVAKDPHEKINLFARPALHEIRADLEENLDRWWKP
jgi:arylsulfatase A-like enzyme